VEIVQVKSSLTVGHGGTIWWLLQRITAVVMVVSGLILLAGYCLSGPFDFASWLKLFKSTIFDMLAWLLVASLCLHAWVGIREVLMDYVKPIAVRLSLHVMMTLGLILCLLWSTMIIWRANG
jgi:succinate dehydrogenase / fumarate reductase membrane anchor subunit